MIDVLGEEEKRPSGGGGGDTLSHDRDLFHHNLLAYANLILEHLKLFFRELNVVKFIGEELTKELFTEYIFNTIHFNTRSIASLARGFRIYIRICMSKNLRLILLLSIPYKFNLTCIFLSETFSQLIICASERSELALRIIRIIFFSFLRNVRLSQVIYT